MERSQEFNTEAGDKKVEVSMDMIEDRNASKLKEVHWRNL